jgi:hypothetical protein
MVISDDLSAFETIGQIIDSLISLIENEKPELVNVPDDTNRNFI